MSADLFRTFGPWALVLLCMAAMLKFLVVDRLNQIMEKLAKVDEHESRIVRLETVIKLRVFMDSEN